MNGPVALRGLERLPALSYRPEIDGLRAVAILLVVFYHAGLGFSGGYVGVDVFFVISGYLITSLILKRMVDRSFTLADFLERRVRRIMPAGIVMVAVVMVAGWFLLLPSDFLDLSKAAMSQTVFSANIYFYKTASYFSGASEEKPLLHTWSLAVEEQFYLLFPVFLVIAWKQRWFRSQFVLIWVMVAGAVASFILNLANIGPNPVATFYLLPMRAWELLLGAIVAVLPAPSTRLGGNPRPTLGILQWIGVAMIIAAGTLYTPKTTFPGLNALLPCLGAALFIWASSGQADIRSGFTPKRILCLRWVVFVGLISYSLYLWHWPIFAFTRYLSLEAMPLAGRIGLVLLSLAIAVFSYRFIERPFRKRRSSSKRSRVFIYGAAALLLTAFCGTLIVISGGVPSRFSPQIQSYDMVRLTQPGATSLPKLTLEDAEAGQLPSFGTESESAPRLLVWGDSHAQNILPALERLAAEKPLFVAAAWFPRTPPVLNYRTREAYSLGDDIPLWSEAVLNYIRQQRISDVLLAGRWSLHLGNVEAAGPRGDHFKRALLDTVKAVRAAGAQVWLLKELPEHKADPVKALLARELFNTDVDKFLADDESFATARALDPLVPDLIGLGVEFLDVAPSLCDSVSGRMNMDKGGVLLFYDSNHLTREGAFETAATFLPIIEPN